MIPIEDYEICSDVSKSTYAETPDIKLRNEKLVKAAEALSEYTGDFSSVNVGLVEQNDMTTVGPEASGKFKLADIRTGEKLVEYLVSWGHERSVIIKKNISAEGGFSGQLQSR